MARANDNDEPASAGGVLPALPSMDGPEEIREILQSAFARPRLRLRILERTALIRFEDAEVLLDEAIAQELGEQLDRLAKLEGHSRTVVNFDGVRYLSSDVLARLARLARLAEPAHGRVQLCGLDPLLRDMLRVTRLDRVFDLCADEAEALGLIVR